MSAPIDSIKNLYTRLVNIDEDNTLYSSDEENPSEKLWNGKRIHHAHRFDGMRTALYGTLSTVQLAASFILMGTGYSGISLFPLTGGLLTIYKTLSTPLEENEMVSALRILTQTHDLSSLPEKKWTKGENGYCSPFMPGEMTSPVMCLKQDDSLIHKVYGVAFKKINAVVVFRLTTLENDTSLDAFTYIKNPPNAYEFRDTAQMEAGEAHEIENLLKNEGTI